MRAAAVFVVIRAVWIYARNVVFRFDGKPDER